MCLLLPDGVASLCELPYTIQEAITMALFLLGFEELPSDGNAAEVHLVRRQGTEEVMEGRSNASGGKRLD